MTGRKFESSHYGPFGPPDILWDPILARYCYDSASMSSSGAEPGTAVSKGLP